MITIKFKNENYNIKNSVKELTIGELENILNIFTKEDNFITKWFDVFIYLGLTEEIIDNIGIEDFKKLIKEFDFNTTSTKLKKSFIINGIEYKAFDSKFKLTVKNVLLIEDYLTINPKKYIAEVIAILYTDKLNNLSIKEKAKIIRDHVNGEIAIPIINLIAITFFANLKTNINE